MHNLGGRVFLFFAGFALMLISFLTFICQFKRLYYKLGVSLDKIWRWTFTFMYVFYLELLIFGIVSFENTEIIDVPSNWTLNGNLTFSDRLSIVLGIAFYICLIILPSIILNVALKQREAIYKNGWF